MWRMKSNETTPLAWSSARERARGLARRTVVDRGRSRVRLVRARAARGSGLVQPIRNRREHRAEAPRRVDIPLLDTVRTEECRGSGVAPRAGGRNPAQHRLGQQFLAK